MVGIDIVELGRVVHFVVLAVVVVGSVLSCRSLIPLDDRGRFGSVSIRPSAALASVIALFGATFRLTPLDTSGRLAVAGACLIVTFVLVAIAVPPMSIIDVMRRPGPLRWMAAYAAAAIPSIAVASDPLAAAGGAAGLLALVAVSLAVAVNFDRAGIGRLLCVLAAAAVAVAVSSAVLTPADAWWTIRAPVFTERFIGWFPFVGLGWGHLGVGLLILGIERSQHRWWGFACGIGLIGITQARGALLVALAVLTLWIALERRRWLAPLALGVLVVGVVAVTVEPVRDVWDREQSTEEADSMLSYRADYVRAAWRVAATSPIIGRGIDSGTVDDFSEELTVGRIGRVESTTMAFTSAIAGTGLIGLLFLAGAHVSAWVWAARRWRTERVRWPLLTMLWVTLSSFFVVGAAELSAQGIVFALAILAVAAIPETSVSGFASDPAAPPGSVVSQ